MTDCKNKLRELLPWYLNHTLSDNETREVEAHLKECPACRKELEELRWLSSEVKELSEAFVSPHIEPEKLVVYLEESEKLTLVETTTIEKHLKSCDLCQEELETLKNVNLELKALENKEKLKLAEETSFLKKIAEGLIWLVRRPAFAYIIILLLAYPAARWIFRKPPTGMLPIPKVASERVHILSEQTRLTTEPTSVFRSEKDNKVRVGMLFWPDLDRNSYELFINTESGQTIFYQKDFTGFGEQGFFQLVLNADSIPDGKYVLILRETNKKDSSISSETYFPFNLSQGK